MNLAGNAYDTIVGKVEVWINDTILMVPNLVTAVLVLLVFYIFARLLRKVIWKTLGTISKNIAVNKIIASIISLGIMITGLFISLGILKLDKTVTSLLAGLGIVGLAAGFAFKETASNLISGFYMAIKSPININDMIEYDSNYGKVKDIGLRATTITTPQGQDVIIPNRFFVENTYKHYTINGVRRIDLEVGISYGDDLEKVERVTIEAIKKIDFIKHEKGIFFSYREFGSSSIDFIIQYWVDYKQDPDYFRALSQGIKNIKSAYDKNNITITFPIRTLDFGIKGGTTLAEMLKES